MSTSSAGNISSSPKIPTDCHLSIHSLAVMHRGLSLQDKPKTPSFSIDKLSLVCTNPNSRKAFKVLQFEDETPNAPVHRRQPSVIIKDINQSYEFTKTAKIKSFQKKCSISRVAHLSINMDKSAHPAVQNDPDSSVSEEYSTGKYKASHRSTNLSKNSMFASTIEPRSSLYNSEIRTSSLFASEIEVRREAQSQDTELTECIDPQHFTKTEGNATTIVLATQGIEIDDNELFQDNEFIYENNVINNGSNDLGILPTKLYCKYCELETSTLVSLKMPTLPIWKVICCVGDFIKCCTKIDNWEKYQEIHHRCRRCKKLIGKYEPKQF
ncbi:unnamed protein product [Blepharisma stoltei]|uniref:LITAF domain-containing protein n=1 Tax=Blepharisma stoltei TaxID=1481888 RepID=A0AAU9IJH2_9CILI|nr:unnamed protein product [Blepharisma stoltei]